MKIINLYLEKINLTKLFFKFQAGDVHGYDWAHHHRKRRDTANFNTKYMPLQDISEKDIPEIGSQIHTRNQVNRENGSLGIAFGMLITSIVLNIFLSYCLYLRNSRLKNFLRQDNNMRPPLLIQWNQKQSNI